jgi:hypothetical protein
LGLLDEIPGIVNDALSPILNPSDNPKVFTITRVVAAAYSAETREISGGTRSVYKAVGQFLAYSVFDRSQTAIVENDRKIILLAASITDANGSPVVLLPVDGDLIATPDGDTYRIIHVDRDPVGATFIIQARR